MAVMAITGMRICERPGTEDAPEILIDELGGGGFERAHDEARSQAAAV